MAEYLTTDTELTAVADAIRAKGGTVDPLEFPDEFIQAIGAIPSGGGGGSAGKKQVNFIDYDGTILYSYTAAEANALNALPENPSYTGLVAQGWNWTLAQIKSQLTSTPEQEIWVGQMYITSSGNTEIDVSMPKGRLSPILTICPEGTLTVDWGDNTTPNTVTGESVSTRVEVSHTYAQAGNYTITIRVLSGSFSFYGDTTASASYLLLRKGTNNNENRVYANCVQAIRLGNGITYIRDNAFSYCSSLASITIPDGVTSIGGSAFYYCYSLSSITIPDGVTSIGGNAFYFCSSLASITIPDGVTSIASGSFQNCSGMSEYHLFPTTPPALANKSAFTKIPSDCVIYVPQGCLEAYKTATNWSTYASHMQEEP